ncbi:NADH-quinone oxidoreductase subunit C [Streptomyces mexicanus]|uniref:NADH-quinone oxidoreductase subunit C n=1 Tax=Streptomyces mexicanus TaxID=178566 RepID=UPI001F4291DF|nr:NADH-quinone oxidoreductase subunit C [Streptomyces mexicanus]
MSGAGTGWLPAPAEELFGADATAEESYDVLTVDVPPTAWVPALRTARDELGCTYFDWLSAVDEPGTGLRVCAHVAALAPVRRLLLRTTVPHGAPVLPSAIEVYAGAAWHERETHEMFGVDFTDHPSLDHLLLPENFEGHPLRKDFVLAARVAKAWPGAKEPGESDHGGPRRRQMLPPGVPDPNEWGPLKGQLPPAPARPARAAGAAGRAAGERPVRRTRTAAQGSASQAAAGATTGAEAAADRAATGAATGTPSQGDTGGAAAGAAAGAARPRRMRKASEGSASQTESASSPAPASPSASAPSASAPAPDAAESESAAARKQEVAEGAAPQTPAAEGPAAEASVAHEPAAPTTPAGPRRVRSASEGSASQRAGASGAAGTAGPRRARRASEGSASQRAAAAEPPAARAPRSSDAPWHHARPAFDEPEQERRPKPQATAEDPRPTAERAQPTAEDTQEATPAAPEAVS